MSLRVPIEALADSIPALRASGVVAVEVGSCELAERGDTMPAPSEEPATLRDPHPDLVPDDEPASDKVARENGWLSDRAQIDSQFVDRNAVVDNRAREVQTIMHRASTASAHREVLLCAGANVGEHFRGPR